MKLIKYRDAGMNTYTYFWVNESNERLNSPFFDSEKEAKDWAEQFEQWKPTKDIT